MNRPALTLLILCAFTFFLGLGRQAITDSDEGYYAEAAREMVESGDWLTPHFNYENRFEKPPLYYWLTASTYLITGPGEGAARFWAAMSALGLTLLTWAMAGGRRKPDTSWLAAALVATSFGCFTMGRWALPDLPLTFFMTLGIWAALRASDGGDDGGRGSLRWWALAGVAAGLGFLTKGPVALVVPGVVLLPIWWWTRRSIRLDGRGIALAALLFVVIGLPWYVLMWREHGTAYLRGFFVGDNVERFTTSRFNDARPLWFYFAVLLGGMLPWSAYLVAFASNAAMDIATRRARFTHLQTGLLIWTFMPLLFYTLSIGKQPRYILPLLPPVAILLAQALVRRVTATRAEPQQSQTGLAVATWITAIFFLVTAFLFARMQPIFITAYLALTWIAVGVAGASSLSFAVVAATRSWTRLPTVIAVTGAAVLVAVQFGALAGKRPEAVEQMAALVRQNRTANESVAVYKVFTRNLGFYTGLRRIEAFEADQAAQYARSPERILFIASADDVKAIEAALGSPLQRLGQVKYVNTANFRLRTLFNPDPNEEIIDALLVSNR